MSNAFQSNARLVTALTMVSRITGFARDAVLARVFGTGVLMDAFNFAFTVPNLFRRLFGEGALTASFLPVYTRLLHETPHAARQFGGLMVGLLAVFLAGVTLVGELVLLVLQMWSSGGESDGLGLQLMMIMLPYMPLVCLLALLGAVLQVHGRFGPSAAAPVILNLGIVAAALVGSDYLTDGRLGFAIGAPIEARRHIVLVAWSVIVAGLLQVGWIWWALRHDGLRVHLDLRTSRAHFTEVVQKALPMLLGLGIFQVNTFIDGLVASYRTMVGPTIFGVEYPLPEGAMTELAYGQRLYEFPLGVFGISIATAIFPVLARQASQLPAFVETLRHGLRMTVFIGLPASVGLVLVRNDLATVVFQGGNFTPEAAQRVGFVLAMYAPAIWAYSMQQVITRAFYARGDSKTPVKVSLGMVGFNFLLNITLIWTPLGVGGLALSTAVCAVVQVIILQRMLSRQLGTVVVDRAVQMAWVRTIAATLVMGGAVWGVQMLLPETPAWGWSAIRLGVMCAVGGGVYYAVARK